MDSIKYPSCFFILFSLLLLLACNPYEEGPLFSLRSKKDRVAGTWIIEEARDANGQDVTETYQGWRWLFDASGDATVETFVDGTRRDFSGSWRFVDDKQGFELRAEGDLSDVPLESVMLYTILKLSVDEFWIRDTSNAEIHLVTQ